MYTQKCEHSYANTGMEDLVEGLLGDFSDQIPVEPLGNYLETQLLAQ